MFLFFYFRENSEELRAAAVAKRKKDIAEINYKIIQEKEKIENEQKVKKRELANIENLEIIKMQVIIIIHNRYLLHILKSNLRYRVLIEILAVFFFFC